MSESGLWNLPQGWRWSDVGSLVQDITAGKSFKCDERAPDAGEVGVVKVSAVTWGQYDERESKTCTQAELVNSRLFICPGDFLFSRANTIELVGACVIAENVTRDVMLSDKILRFEVRPGWKKWLLWSLRSSHGRAEIERLATGNQESMRNIGQERAMTIRIPMPANGEQLRIVGAIESHFTRLDDAVATLEQVERNLKRYRASVLKSAVEGRLVPTEAALAKRERRSYEPASVLLERILTERRRRWSESGKKGKYQEPAPPDPQDLPHLPEGWCWATIGQLTSMVKDGPHYSPQYVADGIPFITGGNVRPEGVDFDNAKRITPELHAELSRRVCPRVGDILYTKGGTTGVARVNTYNFEFNVWVHVAVLRLVGELHPFYIQHSLNSPWCYVQAQRLTHGIGNQDLGLTRMVNITVPLAPLAEQSRIVAEVDRIQSVIVANSLSVDSSRRHCQRLRQSILKWAFEGKLADQDAKDEPASVLLARIKAEREADKSAKAAGAQRPAKKKQVRA